MSTATTDERAEQIDIYVTSDEDQPHGYPEIFKYTAERSVHGMHGVRPRLDLAGLEWELRHHPDRYERMTLAGSDCQVRKEPGFAYALYDQDGAELTPEAIVERGSNTYDTPYRLVMQ